MTLASSSGCRWKAAISLVDSAAGLPKNPAASRLIGYQMLVLADDPVGHREQRHHDAARETAFDAGRHGIDLAAAALHAVASAAAGNGRRAERLGTIGGRAASTGTVSCASTGRTSRNHPTAPPGRDSVSPSDADRDVGDEAGEDQRDAERRARSATRLAQAREWRDRLFQ